MVASNADNLSRITDLSAGKKLVQNFAYEILTLSCYPALKPEKIELRDIVVKPRERHESMAMTRETKSDWMNRKTP